MSEVILDIQNLKTEFRTDFRTIKAVNGIDLQVRMGETVGVVGESGCGKSVTAMSIMGLVEPPGQIVGGKVLFKGEDLLGKNNAEMRKLRGDKISMIFQDPAATLNPVLTIGEQVAEMFRYHRGLNQDEAYKEAIEILDRVGIPYPDERMGSYPFEFSGGMQQRVVIAIAMALDPDLLLADEPTTALDVTIQAQILRLLRDSQQKMGSAIIFITHDLGVAAELCDRVAVIYAGRVVEEADIEKILESPKHPYTRGLVKSIPKMETRASERLNTIPGLPPDPADLPSGCKFHPRCPHVMPECKRVDPVSREVGSDRRVACHLY